MIKNYLFNRKQSGSFRFCFEKASLFAKLTKSKFVTRKTVKIANLLWFARIQLEPENEEIQFGVYLKSPLFPFCPCKNKRFEKRILFYATCCFYFL